MNPIEQLLHDAMTEQTERVPHLRPGSSRRAVVRSRRAHRTRMAAASAATVAATAGVSVFAISLQPAADGALSVGAGGGDSALAPTTAAVPTGSKVALDPKGAAVSVAPQPADQGDETNEVNKPAAEAPAELQAVTLPASVAGLTTTEASYSLRGSGKWTKMFWFHPGGTEDSSGSVVVTRGVEQPHWNQRQSPSPDVSTTTVHGEAATVWLSGGDREIYYRAGDLTVEVFVTDKNITPDQMQAIADAVQGLPQ